MTPLKPKRLSEKNSSNWVVVAEALGEMNGRYVFTCGNSNCGQTINVERQKKRPEFCGKCGNPIDWVDIFIEIVKVCPKCKKQYTENYNFCEIDGNKLDSKPVSKK